MDQQRNNPLNTGARACIVACVLAACAALSACETMAVTAAGAAASAATDVIMGRDKKDGTDNDADQRREQNGWDNPYLQSGGSCTINCGGRRAAIRCTDDEIPVCSCEPTPVTRCELAPVSETPAGKREEPETEEVGEVEEQEFTGNPILLPQNDDWDDGPEDSRDDHQNDDGAAANDDHSPAEADRVERDTPPEAEPSE